VCLWCGGGGAVLLLRQSPLVPFSICNYTVGCLTRLPLLPFFLGTVVGCVPANVLWVSMGAAARAGHDLSRTKPQLTRPHPRK
jgi:uncharacterized membrane protein YdjX (TVP38/TMEM64 family)